MSRKTKKRCKGAISIFLIIIFLSCYILTGLLVDGGRYRMAMTMAESSLDSASSSILSRYNQLVYDLYGLLATDDVSEEELRDLFEHYVDDTLQLADIDYSGLSTKLGEAIFEGEPSGGFFDGYDFQAEIRAGSSVSLASTENVEYQILEHMKYRAPLRVLKGSGGFLDNINNLLNVKTRLEATVKRIEITKSQDKKGLFRSCQNLIQRINEFDDEVMAFTCDPVNQRESAGGMGDKYSKDCRDYLREFDKEVEAIRKREEAEIERRIQEAEEEAKDSEEDKEGGGGGEAGAVDEEAIRREVEAEYQHYYDEQVKKLKETFQAIQNWAEKLYNDANMLKAEVEQTNDRYNEYIRELQAQMDANSGSEDYKTVFGPEIELAKSNDGEILKNMDIVLSTRKYTLEIGCDEQANEVINTLLETSATETVEIVRGHTTGGYASLVDKSRGGGVMNDYFDRTDEDLKSLWSIGEYFYPGHEQEVDVQSVDKISQEEPEETKKEALADLNKEDLTINFSKDAADSDSDLSIKRGEDGSINTKNVTDTMQKGLDLIGVIESALESARDDIYINEYILMSFPNVVHHYNMDEAARAANQEVAAYLLDKEHAKYNATLAEVEYIVTGNADTGASVFNIEARLLGIRTIFNMVSIFTDSAKVAQAQSMAAVSGPFAPLVSILLLSAWAVAEAAIDVSDLMKGEEVPLLKQSGDWKISVEGMVKKVLHEFASQAGDYLTQKGEQYLDRAQAHVNTIIYDVYNTVSDPMAKAQGLLSDTETGLNQWTAATDACGIDAVRTANRALTDAVGQANAKADELRQVTDDAKEWAVIRIDRTFNEAKKNAKGTINNAMKGVSDKMSETIFSRMPLGKVVSGGDSGSHAELKFDYMDYMRVFLLLMNNEKKVQRVQQLIQANMRHGDNGEFLMEDCFTGVWADMDCTIKFLFMSEPIVPAGMRQDGRLKFTIHTSRTY